MGIAKVNTEFLQQRQTGERDRWREETQPKEFNTINGANLCFSPVPSALSSSFIAAGRLEIYSIIGTCIIIIHYNLRIFTATLTNFHCNKTKPQRGDQQRQGHNFSGVISATKTEMETCSSPRAWEMLCFLCTFSINTAANTRNPDCGRWGSDRGLINK